MSVIERRKGYRPEVDRLQGRCMLSVSGLPDGSLLKASSGSAVVYEIDHDQRHAIVWDDWVAMGQPASKIQYRTPDQVGAIPQGGDYVVDGSVIKATSGSAVVYLMEQGTKHAVSWNDWVTMGQPGGDIHFLSPQQIGTIPEGGAFTLEGSLLRREDDGAIFMIQGGKKCWLDPAAYAQIGWPKPLAMHRPLLAGIADGPNYVPPSYPDRPKFVVPSFPDGALLRSSTGALGLVDGGRLRPVASSIASALSVNIPVQNVPSSVFSALPQGPLLDSIRKDIGEIAIRYNPGTQAVGVRLSSQALSAILQHLPEYTPTNTRYNRQSVKWFTLQGIDPANRRLIVGERFRVQKFTDKPWNFFGDSGTISVYDQAWDVKAGVNLEVGADRSLHAKGAIISAKADWPSGMAGIGVSVLDGMFGSLSYALSGNFTTLTQFVTNLGYLGLDSSKLTDLSRYLGKVNDLNQRHVLYLSGIDYESGGIWLNFKADPSRLNEAFKALLPLTKA